MHWQPINSTTFDTPTHRIRRVGFVWLAERKAINRERSMKLGTNYPTQGDAEAACEGDEYRRLTGG